VKKALEHMLKVQAAQNTKAVDLIDQLLHLDPKQRCSASDALSSEYMTDYIQTSRERAFRERYAVEWLAAKEGALRCCADDRRMSVHTAEVDDSKRKAALLMAATRGADDDDQDDLYDLDDLLLDTTPAVKKAKRVA
jgi:hypothetical protein